MSVRINQPFDEFTDTAGKPLENGYIYIGTVNLNPETNAIAVYANAALTVPIAQPIRTIGGYPSYLGAPTRLYTAGDYSITVKSSSGVLVFSDWATLHSVYDYVATSLSTPNTVALRDANGATQLADSTGANSGYAVTSAQTVATTPGILGSTSLATVSTLMARDSSGRARVVDPSNAADISTKNYVDTTASTINAAWAAADAAHAALTTAHGAVSTATASTIVIRDSSSRARVADPSDGADIATKGYVDSNSNVAASFISGATIDNLTTFGYIYSGGSTSPTGSEATTYPATNGATTGAITSSFNTTSPLAGTKDFKLAKGSASSGIGWYYPFTIDPAYFGSVLQIQFPYWNTTTDSDFQVFLWDVTNANFISLSTQAINATPASGTGVSPGTFFATFIAPAITTSRQFRLYVHSTVAGTVGNLNLDNITVGRYTTPNAAAVGGWTSYTLVPAVAGVTQPAKGTNTTDLAQWMRVGQTMDWSYDYVQTAAGTGGSSGPYLFPLPSGYTIDTTKFPINSIVGIVNLSTNADEFSASSVQGNVYVYDASNLTIRYQDPTSATVIENQVSTSSFGLGNVAVRYRFKASFAIAQWTTNINLATDFTEYSFNTTTSDAADTSSYGYGTGGNAFPTGLTAARKKRISFNRPQQVTDQPPIEIYDPTVGTWCHASQTSSGSFLYTKQNAVSYGIRWVPVTTSTFDLEFQLYPLSDAATFGGVGTTSWATLNAAGWKWRVRKVSNGNMAEQPPVVRARYTGVTSTTGVLNYATKDEDTHSAVTVGAAWKFTAPISGVYDVSGSLYCAVDNQNFSLRKSGVAVNTLLASIGAAGRWYSFKANIRLLAGEYIDMNSAGTYSVVGDTFIAITRIGS